MGTRPRAASRDPRGSTIGRHLPRLPCWPLARIHPRDRRAGRLVLFEGAEAGADARFKHLRIHSERVSSAPAALKRHAHASRGRTRMFRLIEREDARGSILPGCSTLVNTRAGMLVISLRD